MFRAALLAPLVALVVVSSASAGALRFSNPTAYARHVERHEAARDIVARCNPTPTRVACSMVGKEGVSAFVTYVKTGAYRVRQCVKTQFTPLQCATHNHVTPGVGP
jgi:hypothetical protein